MTFLALVIAVVMLQVWGSSPGGRYDGWFVAWQAKVWGSGLSQELGFALLIIAPVLLLLFALNAIESVLFGLLWIIAAAGVLLYSFGRFEFSALVERYCSYAQQGDFEGAWLHIQTELAGSAPSPESVDPENEDQNLSSPEDAHKHLLSSLVYEGYQRWFAVVFYFVVQGPAAALAYRLLQLACRGDSPAIAQRWLTITDWIPARLLALTFALAGDFVRSRKVLGELLPGSGHSASEILSDVNASAIGAVPGDHSEADFGNRAALEARESAGLLARSAACWFVVFSLLEVLL